MGLGRALARNLQYAVTDTDTGQVQSFEIVTGTGAYPDWNTGSAQYSGAMSLPAAWRLSIMLSDLLSAVPWHGYRAGPDGEAQRIPGNLPILAQPNPPECLAVTLGSIALDVIWHGNGGGPIVARDAIGRPTRYLPVPAERSQVKRVERGDGIRHPVGTVVYGAGGEWYPAHDWFHVKGPSRPGALRGMGVLENHLATTLNLASEQSRMARGIADSAVPTMALKVSAPGLTAVEAASLKAAAIASQRTRSPMVLNDVTTAEPLSWNPTETQLLEARKFSDVDIANIFGADATWVNAAQTSRVYSNVEQEAINVWRYSSLVGHLARWEGALSALLPAGEWAAASLDAMLRADTLTRYQAHALGISHGFLHPDEARRLEGRAPLTEAQRATMPPPPASSPTPPEAAS